MSMPHAIILKRPSITKRARMKRQDITLTLAHGHHLHAAHHAEEAAKHHAAQHGDKK
jgi:hypothetical protein